MEHRDQNEQHDQSDLAAQIRRERLATPRHEAMMSAGRSGGSIVWGLTRSSRA